MPAPWLGIMRARTAIRSSRCRSSAGLVIVSRSGVTLANLGYYELWAGALDAARSHLAEALDSFRVLKARDSIVYHAANLGLAEYLSGSPEAAEVLFAESFDVARRTGMKEQAAYGLIDLAMTGRHGADPAWSARLHGAADQILTGLGRVLEPLESHLAGLDRQRLRTAMGADAFEAEYAVGHALDLAQVLATLRREDAAAAQARVANAPDDGEPRGAVTMLTPREVDVLKLVAQGLRNSEIAHRLVLSDRTVHRHLANIRRKLGLSSRAAAAAWGVRAGLV
jgi:DNA-binding CsgD family transcriptional regulator